MATYLPELRRLARRLARNGTDAEDLVQETCLRALTDLAQREAAPANPRSWLRVILKRGWLNGVRAARAEGAAVAALAGDRTDRALDSARVTRAQLVRLVARVPPKARGLVVACLLEGEQRASVTARTGVSAEAIDASIYRARGVFRDAGLGP